MTTRTALIAQAKTWLDVPVRPSGAQRVGVNCLGLFVGILHEAGGFEEIVDEAEKHVGFRAPISAGDFLRELKVSRYLRLVYPSQLRLGNFVLLFTRDGPQHLAFVTEPGVILHASARKKKVIEHLLPIGWKIAAEFEIVGLVD
ncbi:hypothetical protein LCGC14_1846550 [marine sediment metagenome]|uniref:NlpC/P60 domain-containing protein n=1 Tax=marine sediment metagenome TaxID=412755 RepID=A0A0F9JAW2_9ZZZZ